LTITQEVGQELLDLPVKGNKTITMLKALIAAKLNIAAGCDVSCIGDTVAAADEWMDGKIEQKDGEIILDVVKASSSDWQCDGESFYLTLDEWNNSDGCD
jgi:hypothetical protein